MMYSDFYYQEGAKNCSAITSAQVLTYCTDNAGQVFPIGWLVAKYRCMHQHLAQAKDCSEDFVMLYKIFSIVYKSL